LLLFFNAHHKFFGSFVFITIAKTLVDPNIDYTIEENWTVEKFVGHQAVKGKEDKKKRDGYYLLKTRWIAFSPENDTLEPLNGTVCTNLEYQNLLANYVKQHPILFDKARELGVLPK
jgi:hypothetical protein